MKSKESNQIINEKISIFNEVLEYIDTNQIEQVIDKLSKKVCLDGLIEEDEIKYEENVKQMNSSDNLSFPTSQMKNSRYPNYDGSFKKDITKFFQKDENKDLNKLYELVMNEIKKIYLGYTHIENKLYNKINQYIQFSDGKNNTPMEIISKLKEISETLLDTIKFIELYLFKNFQILQKIFYKIDLKLSSIYEVESISLFFLLNIFDLPNNELSYMLMFKIIDEESCVLKYIIENLDMQIKGAKPKNNNTENNDLKSTDNEACLLDDKSTLSSAAYTAMLNIRDKYINNINESLDGIDSYNYFRAKYYNKYIYIKGNYEVDTNLFLNYLNDESDDNNNEEFLPINSLMDEEVIISKFIKKSIINKFLKYFKSNLPISYKRNEKLIMLHTIHYNIISVFVIYWYDDYKTGFINISVFYLGKFLSKMIFNSYIRKRKKIKSLLISSNIILICSLILHLFFKGTSFHNWIYYGSRFLIGLSFAKNIETKFILNYVPKLLVKKTIKQYYSIIYLSLCFGFFLSSGLNYLLCLIKNNKDIENELNDKKLDINNISEVILAAISFIILIINFIFFKNPKLYDLIKSSNSNPKENTNANKTEISSKVPNQKDNAEEKKETASIFSYGKAKLISFKEKSKAKLMEESLKIDIGEKKYEGTNQIFTILQKLIINENTQSKSYTNKVTKGYIFLFTLLYIISSIVIFYTPLIKGSLDKDNNNNNGNNVFESKNKVWIFGFPYLFAFFIYVFKVIKISSDITILNIIILIFICLEIGLNIIFLVFDNLFFEKTPLVCDSYYFYCFLALILFFNIIIEMFCLKVMIRQVPIEKKISSINIDNFVYIYECLIRSGTFVTLYFIIHYSIMKKSIYVKIALIILYILGCVIFVLTNFKKRQIALIKIINKVTYESF